MEEESAGTETNPVLINDHDEDDDGDHDNADGDHDDNGGGDIRDDINGDGSIIDDDMITTDVINNNNGDPIINDNTTTTTTTTTTTITSDNTNNNIVSNTEEAIEKDNEMITTTTIMKMTHNDHQVMNLLHIESNDDINENDVNEGNDEKKIGDTDDMVNDDDNNNQPTILNAKSVTALATTNIMTIDKQDVTFDPITNIAYCKVTNDNSINQINDHDMVGLITLEGGHEKIEGENGKMDIVDEEGKISQVDDTRTVVMEVPTVVVMEDRDGRRSVLGSMFNKWINDNDDDDGNNYYNDDDDDKFNNCFDIDEM